MNPPFRIVADPARAPVLAPLATDESGIDHLERSARAVGAPFAAGAIVVGRPDPDVARALAAALDGLGGRVLAMPGPSVPWPFFAALADATPHALGRKVDASRFTALGVLAAIRGALGRPLAGVSVAVLGVGRVGAVLVGLLAAEGARVVLADLDPGRAADVAARFGAATAPVPELLAAGADVFSPNARGVAITAADAARVRARLVAGSQPGALGPGAAPALARRGVRVVPDELAGSGCLLALEAELRARAGDAPSPEDLLRRIEERSRDER